MTIKQELAYLRHARKVALAEARHLEKRYGKEALVTIQAQERAAMLVEKVQAVTTLIREKR